MQNDISQKKKRLDYIDVLRALAMIFVVYGHQVPDWHSYFVFTSPVKLCLFFSITGFVVNVNADSKIFFYKLLRQIIAPWLILTIVPRLLFIPIKGISWFLVQLQNIITGEAYWYMPCLVVAEIIWFVFQSMEKKYNNSIIVLCILSFLAGMLCSKHGVLRIFMIDTALTSEAFFLIGYEYKKNRECFFEKKRKWLVLFGSLLYVSLGVLSLLIYPDENLDVHLNHYYNFPICLLMIVVGVLVLFIFADFYLIKCPSVLCLIGKNTLIIYLFHTAIINSILLGMNKIGLESNRIVSVLLTIISIAIACIISIILKKLFPYLFGIKKDS